ncbi:programmed cell death protein 2 [Mucidula mucida]|nr:programmed cell death protein 2 [Mucidula mucida]
MAQRAEDDWSDSDEEVVSDEETSVLLGVPDGPITASGDLTDAAVSRIGGLPVRYPMHVPSITMLTWFISKAFLVSPDPSLSSSQCKICSKPMELLVQMWCPFEDSPMDRALYIWGCATAACQKKDGSIRAWRALRFNSEYAVKLEKKLAKRKEKQAAKIPPPEKKVPAANPFLMNSSAAAPNPFALGSQVFGTPTPPPPAEEEQVDDEADESDAESTSSEHSLITALTSTTLEDSPWKAAPQYPPKYLSTSSEYVAPEPKRKVPSGADILAQEDDGKGDKSAPWSSEAYENSLNIDQVFEKFSTRVEYEPEQCVRYELNGTPLPFGQGPAFDVIFPPPPAENLPVTKPDFKVVRTVKRSYTTDSIPKCPSCGSKRVFECQLMPNLINILKDASDKGNALTDEERRKAVEKALKGDAETRGMDWGTVMVFSCEKDCCTGEGAKEAWREEHVLIQWDMEV